jgi:hypothetical protein
MNNETKQTAVEWLVEKINEQKAWANPQQLKPLIKQAKEMEKQQMIDFARNYMLYIHKEGIITIETYYNETYGGNK